MPRPATLYDAAHARVPDVVRLRCGTCGFGYTTHDGADAYGTARTHEATDPAHFVLIEHEE